MSKILGCFFPSLDIHISLTYDSPVPHTSALPCIVSFLKGVANVCELPPDAMKKEY